MPKVIATAAEPAKHMTFFFFDAHTQWPVPVT